MGYGEDLGNFETNLKQMEEDLYKTALLGTDRMTPSVSTLEKLREMGIETDDATEAVLTGVGMLSLARKGGYPLLDFEGELPSLCPIETKSYMSARAAKYIQDVLDKKVPIYNYLYASFFQQIAECAAQNNKIVPIGLLPTLLNQEWQGGLEQLIGERGKWLVVQNPKWVNVLSEQKKPTKLSASEIAGINLLRGMPLKTTANLYNQAFDIMKKIGLIDENAARVALFWCTIVEEMEK